ncbi:MAG: methyltransferase domain-containing protein [Bacteroidetes bacterium]|nr:methyltransferase domain-containing protein [Bacteroidota bacterium]
MPVNREYILGSDAEELRRLEFQHKVWTEETFALWSIAGISLGSNVLDIGCGPGFTSFDMSAIVGETGKVTGIDKTENYVRFANRLAAATGASNTEFIHKHFDEMILPEGEYDFIYSRWVFSWVTDWKPVLAKMMKALKPGGKLLFQEYIHWATLKVYPEIPEVEKVISACRSSWEVMDSEINVCPLLLKACSEAGMKIQHKKLLPKLGKSRDLVWQWPGTFLKIYSEKLVEYELLKTEERNAFLKAWDSLEENAEAFLSGPLMMEFIAEKET